MAPLLLEIQERGEWQDMPLVFLFSMWDLTAMDKKNSFFGMHTFLYSLLFDALKDAANPQVVVSV